MISAQCRIMIQSLKQNEEIFETMQPIKLEVLRRQERENQIVHTVQFQQLLLQLKKPTLEKIINHMCSYFCPKMGCYIYVGVYKPSEHSNRVSIWYCNSKIQKVVRDAELYVEKLENLTEEHSSEEPLITLKFREKAKGENTDTLVFTSGQTETGKGSRREKERKIGEVVIKVSAWRNLYNDKKVTLEMAAEKVGISKKSLDDYFLQLK